jgi:glycosyltransferase involved in cell wall biosynthesis
MIPTPSRPVVHVIAPSPAGGAESVIVALACGAAESTRVILLNQTAAAGDPPLPMASRLRRCGVEVVEVRQGRRHYFAEVREVAGIVRRLGAGLLHTHGYHGTVVGYAAARRTGLPAVATVHGYLERNLKERLYNVVDRWILRRFDAVVAVSDGIAEQLRRSGIEAERLFVVQNGIAPPDAGACRDSARQEFGVELGDRVVGWVGRLSPEKGPDLFLEALGELGPGIRGVLIGDGPELTSLRRQAARLGLLETDRVIFAGHRSDASRLLPAFDVLALTSRVEGTPMVVLEAVAANVPVAAFAVGGIPQLLTTESAWLAPPLDVPRLVEALREATGSGESGRSRAAAALAHLGDRLSMHHWLQRLNAVYGRISGRGQPLYPQ